LAWARLAEIWLALGYRSRALEAAGRAAELSPDLSLTHSVQGFAALAAFRPVTAKEAFERAIRLNSADPLAHFGLGLAEIRQSNLNKGRREIEIAVGLDPNNALLRAYLGKAYFAERADSPGAYLDVLEAQFTGDEIDLAGEQFAIAKELDPKDPTAWFYDAILKQSQNRPVEALRDVQEAIRLNDNRAIFRSRELLDEDRAARGASLARIYDDLGFEQLGVNEAAKSLAFDPASTSAHRFLSDIYATHSRVEIARVSELLQAQLLQDVNINPVQPSLSETNLNIFTGGGPTTPGLGEFAPLFERNQAQLNVSGEIGNNNTRAGEAVVSGLYDRFSLSAGQFHYKTDGFRENFDLKHDITNFFAQAAITPELNIQAEYRRRRTKEGDIRFNFDPDDYSTERQRKFDSDTGRVGLRYSPTPSSDFIGSFIYSDVDEKNEDVQPFLFEFIVFPGFPAIQIPDNVPIETHGKQKGPQFEGQYIYRHSIFNAIVGGLYYDFDSKAEISLNGQILNEQENFNFRTRQKTFYTYSNVNYPTEILWTLGASYDDFDENRTNTEKVSPKFGVQWSAFDNLIIRGAVFQTVKPALIANQTIQPTQISGFNQFFDDANGTKSWVYGAGLDVQFTQDVSGGLEASFRDLDEPTEANGISSSRDREETVYRGYLYWTPHAEWAIRGEVVFDKFTRDQNGREEVPRKVETLSVPVAVSYFNPTGFFASVDATYSFQNVDRDEAVKPAVSVFSDGDDSFTVFNAAIGYRFPQRRGLVSVEVNNIFDTHMKYQDDNFREFGENSGSISPFLPERTILARLTLNF